MKTIRVLIADDHPLMLRSLRLVLDGSDQVEVVGEATTGTQVLPLVESTCPQVVLLDVQLPELDGFACLERIVAGFPDVSVVMVSATDHPRTIDEAEKRGASGYIVKTVAKGSPADEIGLRGSTQLVNISGQEVPLGGDIILSVEGIPAAAANLGKIRETMSKLPAGAPYKASILRAGQVLELTGKVP